MSASHLRLGLVLWLALCGEAAAQAPAPAPDCDADDGGLTLPRGFCALVVADDIGRARHLAVAKNGDIYVALRGGRDGGGGIAALRDTTGDGRADVVVRFGSRGGTGIALREGYLYLGADDRVVRYAVRPGRLEPAGEEETIVSGLPAARSHAAKPLAFGDEGSLYVSVGSPSNSCQMQDRQTGSPGKDPCRELETRAGIWRFDASRPGQTQGDGERVATGLRNTVALAVNPENGSLYGVMHGRDQLFQNWPGLYTAEQGAEKPSEEFVRIGRGDDFGWPYCYHDPELGRLVLAPEYGGDGRRAGRCGEAREPILSFPAHWGPNALLFYTGSQFPERFRGGAFIAFHGSWNRAPLPQQGYHVVFVPFAGGEPTGDFELFADGFAGAERGPRTARHRPSGLAQGPDGSLYVADDAGGRIWRILYRP